LSAIQGLMDNLGALGLGVERSRTLSALLPLSSYWRGLRARRISSMKTRVFIAGELNLEVPES